MSEINLRYQRVRSRRTAPKPLAVCRTAITDGFSQLKHRLLRERLAQEPDPELRGSLERAAQESAAVAWTTPFPLLVWPELLEEASRAARSRAERQRSIKERTRPHRTLAA